MGGEFTHVDIEQFSFCISNFSTYLVSGSGFLARHIVEALRLRAIMLLPSTWSKHFDVSFCLEDITDEQDNQQCHPEGKIIILLHLGRKRKLSVGTVAAPNM